MKRSGMLVALGAFAAISVAGCSKESSVPGTLPTTGMVRQKGAPLADAMVTFSPAGQTSGKAASGKTDASGKFTLTTLKAGDGALPGDYEVIVSKVETSGKAMTDEEAREYYNKFQKPPPAPQSKSVLPEKYSKGTTSGLKATVKKGDKNEFTFDVD